jgi:hypothetical protein
MRVAPASLIVLAGCLTVSVPAQQQARIPPDQILGDLRLHRGPYDKPGSGALAKAGYAARDVRFIRAAYQSQAEPLGEANVQIVKHPPCYPYVAHDFYGVFATVQDEGRKRKATSQVDLGIEFVERESAGQPVQYLCRVVLNNPPGKSGILGWMSNDAGNTITVFIAYEHLPEPPWRLVDTYLGEYPSEIAKGDSRPLSWYTEDIEKWIDLLQTRGNESFVLQTANVYLRRYDPKAFGLAELWAKREHPAALANGVEAAVGRMNNWLQKRQSSQDQDKHP